MKHFMKEITQIKSKNIDDETAQAVFDKLYPNCLHAISAPAVSLCFFDIETTGLSPAVSSVYLIGALVIENNKLMLHQWFADDYTSEQELLTAFASFAGEKKLFIHYNGSSFDIPYLTKKYQAHHLACPFDGTKQLDLFKGTKLFQTCFSLKNRKLKTMETLLGFHRHDNYSGKDCISLYTDFMHQKFFRDSKSELSCQKLLLHNEEDLIGTFLCSQLLLYQKPLFLSGSFYTEDGQAYFTGRTGSFYPRPLVLESGRFRLICEDSSFHLQIPLFSGTLYHFFPDYKNYFYLPGEDMAIHKSVGVFVETAFRQKATASNCYIKKEDKFLPLPLSLDMTPFLERTDILFTSSRKSKQFYIPLPECEKLFAGINLCDFMASYAYAIMTAPSPA